MRILAIDCGTKTGWAALTDRIESGVQTFDLKRGESSGMRFIRFSNWLGSILALIKPNLVVYEQAHHRGGFATELIVGMNTRILEKCEFRKINYQPIHSKSLKKFSTGSGNSSKEAMIEEAKKRFPNIEIIDDNHADALLMLAWAKEEFKE